MDPHYRIVPMKYRSTADAVVRGAANELTHCGQTGLVQPRLMLTQKLLACAASLVCQRSIFRRTGHSNRSILADCKSSSSSCKSYAIERIATNRLRYFRRDSSRSCKFTLMASDFCFASRSRPDQRASIHQNAMLVPGKGFLLCLSQHHDGIIDAEAIASRLVPNAFARFW